MNALAGGDPPGYDYVLENKKLPLRDETRGGEHAAGGDKRRLPGRSSISLEEDRFSTMTDEGWEDQAWKRPWS